MSEPHDIPQRSFPPHWLTSGYAYAVAAVVVATLVSWPMFPFVEPANLVMTYLLAVVFAAVRGGRGPSVLASVLGVAAYDFFFVPPYLTLAVADKHYVFSFAVMLVVALVITGLTARIRRQAEAARHREERTAALYAMSRELAEAGSVDALVAIAARHVGTVFDADVVVLLAAANADLTVAGPHAGDRVDADEFALCRSVLEHGEPAGLGTATSPRARARYLPLGGHRGPLGVVKVAPHRRDAFGTDEARRQLETFVNQAALALERVRAAADAQDARVRAETERLRSSLLTSVSHDLRTPLATITGAATTMLEAGGSLDTPTQTELLESIRDEAERLNRIVQNLLDLTRLESGALQLRREWHPLEEVIGAALRRQDKRLRDRQVTVNVPPDLPLVAIDDVLIEQLLVNLLDNALKYTAPDTPLRIIATATDASVTVICRSIAEAHGGRIWAQNLPEGGASFLFTLPLTGAPAAVPRDA
ncbi:MAG: DUF4118 domain-containing protein [Candidatus Rokubacteria bacterium]|nr:DUF4118 domain-containing protein [Candidatus Rokubacteria bacterium]